MGLCHQRLSSLEHLQQQGQLPLWNLNLGSKTWRTSYYTFLWPCFREVNRFSWRTTPWSPCRTFPATLLQRPGVVDPSMGSRHLAIAGEWEYPRSRKPHGTGRRPWKKPCRCHIQGYVFTYMTKPHYTHDIFIYTLICFFVGKPFGCPGKRYIYIFYLYAHVHLEFLSYQRSS